MAKPPANPTATPKGFTLIELIVVLIIIALMAGFAVPRILPAESATALKTRTGEIASLLRRTRSAAIRSNRIKSVVIDIDARRLKSEASAKSVEFPKNAALKFVAAAENKLGDRMWRIMFYPDGSSSGGRISILGHGREYHVDIEWFTGHVSIDN